jgi:cytoskeleton protein RodZ
VPSFGEKLKQQREKRGVSLEEISLTTKIGSRFLQALETNRFDQLPGGIFNKGFVRAYAKSVGMDENEAVAEYLEAIGVVPESSTLPVAPAEIRVEAETAISRQLPWGTLALVLLVVALALALWGFRRRESEASSSPIIQVADQKGIVPTPLPGSSPMQPRANPVSAPSPSSPKNEPKASTPAPFPDDYKTATTPAPASAPINLKIKAREDSWISVTVDGEVATRNTMITGSEKSVRADHDIMIKAGNVGALDFELNGKALSSQGDIGEVKALIFDGTGVHSAPTMPAAPSAQNGTPQP